MFMQGFASLMSSCQQILQNTWCMGKTSTGWHHAKSLGHSDRLRQEANRNPLWIVVGYCGRAAVLDSNDAVAVDVFSSSSLHN